MSTPQPAILVFGEILWDVMDEVDYIGGAAFNFAAHAVRCGVQAELLSRVGTDERGDRAVAILDRLRVGRKWLQRDVARPTGWVEVSHHSTGQPSYRIVEKVAWDAIAPLSEEGESELRGSSIDALVFGSLAQRSPASAEALRKVRAMLPGVTAFYDVNLRSTDTPLSIVRSSLRGASIVKMNENEERTISQDIYGRCLSSSEFFSRLREDYQTEILLITLGELGCRLVSVNGVINVPGVAVPVVSAVGAGDAFGASFLSSLLNGKSVEIAAMNANRLGAWVAGCKGAVPEYEPTPYGHEMEGDGGTEQANKFERRQNDEAVASASLRQFILGK